jgi:(p)ppGpp synthase/HD superfamily hydrolase
MVKAALPRLAQHSVDDMLAAVGRGEIPSANVLKAVYPDHKPEAAPRGRSRSEEGWFGLKRGSGMKFRVPGLSRRAAVDERAIPIRGLHGDMPVRFAEGGALPGDRIVGIMTPGEGITIYPIQSPALKEFDDEPERWLDVRWDIDESKRERFPARIQVSAINEPGTLAQVAQVIAEHDGDIANLVMNNAPDFTSLIIDLGVWDLKHLMTLIAQLRALKVVSTVSRLNG